MTENQQVEFKREYTDDIKREIVAFLNSNDGTVFIGIDDNGTAVGVDDPDEVMKRVSQSVRNGIRPDCMRFIHINSETSDGKTIVRINVVKGTQTPYYLGDKGIRPNGVFVRLGSTTVQAQENVIRDLVRRADGDSYERRVSYRQDLTFSAAESAFASAGVAFGDNQKHTLGIINSDGFFTDLGLLISDQCEHSIKCAIFEGETKEIFKDRKEFGGSLIKQIDDVYEYINVYNKTSSVISGKLRTDSREYPPTAVREALLNAVVHRDYAYSGSTLVNLYCNRLEIVSLGGLADGITEAAVKRGISQPRNKLLANIFYRLGYIEAYGTGIPRIYGAYSDRSVKPELSVSDGVFIIELPNIMYADRAAESHNMHERKIIAYLTSHDGISKEEAAKLIDTKVQRAYGVLRKMENDGVLRSVRSGKKNIYFLDRR